MEPSSESDGPVTTVKSPLTLLFAGITLGLCALLIDALRNPAGVMVRGGWLPRETLAGNRARGVS